MRPLIVLLFLAPLLSFAQSDIVFDPDSILVGDAGRARVLLVGTFHFDYPGLDGHKTSDEDKIDVLVGQRADEVAELNDYIARFRPTKIVVESSPGSTVNEQYRRYLAGDFELNRDEIDQIAFRLGKQFGIDSLIPGNANNLSRDLYYDADSAYLRPFLDRFFVEAEPGADTTIHAKYAELYVYDDQLLKDHSLLEVFKYMNSRKRVLRGHGHYLEFSADADPDGLAIGWYSRNLRIYRNIQKATTSANDRILVLFGSGHMSILRQQFESSPRYELVEFGDL